MAEAEEAPTMAETIEGALKMAAEIAKEVGDARGMVKLNGVGIRRHPVGKGVNRRGGG